MPENASSVNVEKLFSTACELPYCKIDREEFLTKELKNRVSPDVYKRQDEERMEKQARGIAPRILMPKKSTQIKLQELFASRSIPKDGKHRIAAVYKRQVT